MEIINSEIVNKLAFYFITNALILSSISYVKKLYIPYIVSCFEMAFVLIAGMFIFYMQGNYFKTTMCVFWLAIMIVYYISNKFEEVWNRSATSFAVIIMTINMLCIFVGVYLVITTDNIVIPYAISLLAMIIAYIASRVKAA